MEATRFLSNFKFYEKQVKSSEAAKLEKFHLAFTQNYLVTRLKAGLAPYTSRLSFTPGGEGISKGFE
jgi:hypothetical protein